MADALDAFRQCAARHPGLTQEQLCAQLPWSRPSMTKAARLVAGQTLAEVAAIARASTRGAPSGYDDLDTAVEDARRRCDDVWDECRLLLERYIGVDPLTTDHELGAALTRWIARTYQLARLECLCTNAPHESGHMRSMNAFIVQTSAAIARSM